ncbi:MAG TPA: ABC transporter permease [Cyclobacteriaceae bacterium]|nr:ABC transporter permease [Cyclobacteriaceae bacterium]
MFKTIVSSFLLAFHNIRSHFFHTLLSVLGIVIGVAALVSILSLIDGMEHYAKEQITKTTSLKAINVWSNQYQNTNGVRVRRDNFPILDYEDYSDLKNKLTKPCSVHYMSSFAGVVDVGDSTRQLGTMVYALGSPEVHSSAAFTAGRIFTKDEITAATKEVLVNHQFVKLMDSTITPNDAIGRKISFRKNELMIKSVFDDKADQARMAFPLTLLSIAELRANPPSITVDADAISDVADLKSQIQAWLKERFPVEGDFVVVTNDARVKQATEGFLLFRIIMGLIVGISVVVGGIGIMNVLLISITERTVEIGIRKAVGANRRDIILQFLAESVTVSVFGSLVGLILGVLGTMAVVPIVASITKIPFYANYTLNTMIVVSVMAVLLGIIFGTYPAIRASRLDPVEAIRHE